MLVLDLGVRKATAADITALHARQLAGARLVDGVLTFPDAGWDSRYLGRGEEKAVYAVCDGAGHVFAVELIDERSYLNGRFVTGEYFPDLRPRGLGRVKVREFADGYEWGRCTSATYSLRSIRGGSGECRCSFGPGPARPGPPRTHRRALVRSTSLDQARGVCWPAGWPSTVGASRCGPRMPGAYSRQCPLPSFFAA